jgi:hypothetical protein
MANIASGMEVQKLLDGIEFPADKQALIKNAKEKGAPNNVMSALNSLPSRDYESAEDVLSLLS